MIKYLLLLLVPLHIFSGIYSFAQEEGAVTSRTGEVIKKEGIEISVSQDKVNMRIENANPAEVLKELSEKCGFSGFSWVPFILYRISRNLSSATSDASRISSVSVVSSSTGRMDSLAIQPLKRMDNIISMYHIACF